MGMGFKARASHPHHNQTRVPPRLIVPASTDWMFLCTYLWNNIFTCIVQLKVHCPIFQNWVSVSSEESSLQRWKFEILVETVTVWSMFVYCRALPISYCVLSLIMVTTRHIFINTRACLLKNPGELKIALLKGLWRAVRWVITMESCRY